MLTPFLKRVFSISFLLLIAIQLQAGDVVRMMSYNVRNGRGLDEVRDCQRIANVINNVRPDIVAVQELDSVTGRSGKTDVLQEIAVRTQMNPLFAAAIPYDGGKYGIGILSKVKPIRVKRLALPGREEQRALIIAEFDKYLFACTHLSLTEEDRMQSLSILRNEAKATGKPFFLAGDFNSEANSDFIRELKKDFQVLSTLTKPTFPANKPKELLDYIIAAKQSTPTFVVRSSKVGEEPVASDHRPIWVDIAFAADEADIFRTKPYLQNPLNNGITVIWQTNVPAHCWVEYGTSKDSLVRARTLLAGQEVCNNTLHKIRLENLRPGETYYYRICSEEILLYQAYRKVFGNKAQSEFYQFTLPEPKTDHFTAVVFNDLHKQSQTLQKLCQQIKGIDYDFVVFNGDCVDDPANHDEATAFVSELTEAVGGANIPTFFMRGNHEIRNAFSVAYTIFMTIPAAKHTDLLIGEIPD